MVFHAGSCGAPGLSAAPALGRASGKNIFTDQEEIALGDAMADNLAREFTLIDDPALIVHLEQLGRRLAAYLPPNHLRF